MSYTYPSATDFKAYFTRDFPYGTDPATSVLDADIVKAIGQAEVNWNPGLWGSQSAFTIGFLYLTAHWLVIDLRMSSQGINGQYQWTEASKSVGNVAQAFAIPQRILDNPTFAMFAQTNYGAKYLQLLLPQLVGQTFIAYGSTRP